MSGRVGRGLGAVLAVASILALAALTRAPYRAAADDEARIRLSWRIRSEQVRACVPPSPEELERLPPHMRNPDACVGDVPPFRLRVSVDGRVAVDSRVEASGARGDRPIYVLREVSVSPGSRRVQVEFEQQRPAGESADFEGEPLDLELDSDVELEPREVVLVTLDPASGRLVLRP